jgi:hypothetical protein
MVLTELFCHYVKDIQNIDSGIKKRISINLHLGLPEFQAKHEKE